MYCPVLFINRNRSWIVSKLVERFPGHCPAVCRSFTSRPSDCRCKILACEVQACAESKVSIYFSPFSFQLFFRFPCLIFFSLAGHLVGFISVGKKVFRKALRWKERYVVSGTRFSRKFSDQCCNFFFRLFLRCSWLNYAHSGIVWKIFPSAQVSGQSCPWPLELMASQAVERTCIGTGGYGRLIFKWIKHN